MSVFAVVFTSIWVLTHAYLGRALIRGRPFSRRIARVAGWTLLAVLAVLPPAVFVFARLAPGAIGVGASTAGWTAFGFSSLLFAFTAPVDLVRFAHWAWRRLRRGSRELDDFDSERRRFFGDLTRAGIVGSAGGLTAVGYRMATRVPPVRDVDIEIDGLAAELDGFHIVQLTDIHVGPTIRAEWLRAVVARANELAPDIMAVTGDVVDGLVSTLAEQVAPLASLRGRIGTYYVTGNHEYYWGAPAWVEEFERLGMTPLMNEHVVIEHEGVSLVLGGVTDHRSGGRVRGHDSDPHAAMEGAPNDAAIRILLAHQPRSVTRAAEAGWDLQLSGHTHGGQFFPYSLLIGLLQPYGHGLHRHAERTWIYVSRGTGYWGPPNRAGATSEITSIHLRRRA